MMNKLLGSIKLPGYIQIAYSPEGSSGGGGTEPAGGGSAPSGGAAPSAPAAGGSPAPAQPSSPSGEAAATPATPAQSAPQPLPEDPFSGFGAEEGDDDETPAAVAAPEEPAAEATPPQPQPAAPTPAQPQAPQAPQQAQPGPQEAGAQPPTPQLPTPAEPARMADSIQENLEAMAEHLAGTPEFKLSEADIEAINNDVVAAIPKITARTFLRAQAGALRQMERVVPALVERYMKVSKARDASQAKFYARWPQVKADEHGAVVDRLAQTYRRENPSATLEQMVEDLGPLVMMVAKIPLQPTAPQQNGQAGTPMVGQPRRPPPTPFQPAVGGPASPPAAQAHDPWSGYGAETDE